MREDEAGAFYMIISNGVHPKLDEFVGKGKWTS